MRLNKSVLACVCFVISSTVVQSASGHQNNSKDFAISKEVDLVLLPVTVTDRSGEFVSGLHASNFNVYENGHAQTISVFRDGDVPVTVGLVVDHSGSMAANQEGVIEGARAFVQDSNAQDKEFVVNFSSAASFGLPQDLEFTNNVEVLENALAIPPEGGRTALYDAVIAALQRIDEDQSNKKVLLLISDGGDNASKHTFAQALRMAQAANVVIYAIGLLDEHSADQNPDVLKKLASETGGESYFPGSEVQMVEDCRQIAGDIRHQYTLGYNPVSVSGSGYRKIRVHVSASGRGKLFVRTRAGYYLPPAVVAQPLTHREDP